MTDTITIVISADIQRFAVNVVSKATWHAMAKLRRAAGDLAHLTWLDVGSPRPVHDRLRLDVHIVRGTGRTLDEPNVWAALKPFIDGICRTDMIIDDSPRYLKCGEITQTSHKRYKDKERIELAFTPIEPLESEDPPSAGKHHDRQD